MLARDNVLFRRDYLEELTGRPAIVNMFVVKVDRADAVPAVIASIDETFANSAAETETQSQAEFARSMLAEYRLLFDGFLVLAVIVMLAIGLVAANTAAMSVRERRSEIAVMRALGYPRSFVFGALLAEGLAVSVPAGLAGCAGAYGVTRVLPYASETLGPLVLNMMFPANVLIMSLAAATAIGVLASFVPAFNAVRRNIVEGLRPAG
jgi:putative ABC transport system permease protein